MSRTYRRSAIYLDRNHNPIPRNEIYYVESYGLDYYSKRNSKRDRKPWHKSSKSWKKILANRRKSQVRQAMKKGNYDNIPTFHRENDWEWW